MTPMWTGRLRATLTTNTSFSRWVAETTRRCLPDQVAWCDGSEQEKRLLIDRAVEEGVLIALNQKKRPGCYLHRSDPKDVARVEHLTFICTEKNEEAGPTNHWMAPAEAYAKLEKLLEGSMRGRTMYVIPYVMGPLGSPFSKIGVEITDSVYVALSMRIMTRMESRRSILLGTPTFSRGVHSMLDLNPSAGTSALSPRTTVAVGGQQLRRNVLLGKNVPRAALGSYLGHREGWSPAHADPGGRKPRRQTTYVAGAFPTRAARRTSRC